MLPLLAAAAVLFGAGVAAASYYGERGARTAPDFAVVPTGLRVVLLGIDGLDAGLADALVARGQMPHLQALRLAGRARAPRASSPSRCPRSSGPRSRPDADPTPTASSRWAAAGSRACARRSPSATRAPSRARSATRPTCCASAARRRRPSVLRSVKALWNVASEKGLRVGVVNWWATWPADPVNGYVVTDRAFFKLEKGGAPDREVHPPEAFATLAALPRPADADRARALDRFHAEAARHAGGAEPSRPGGAVPARPRHRDRAAAGRGRRVRPGRPRRAARAGARALRVRGRADRRRRGARGAERAPGARGRSRPAAARRAGAARRASCCSPAARYGRATSARRASATSRRPCCTCSGLPTSRELDGRVLDEALTGPFREAHPVRTVDSYGGRAAGRPTDSGFDRAMLEELKRARLHPLTAAGIGASPRASRMSAARTASRSAPARRVPIAVPALVGLTAPPRPSSARTGGPRATRSTSSGTRAGSRAAGW